MVNFILLCVCFVLGLAIRMAGIVDEKGPAALNAVVIYMSMPALALLYAHSLPMGVELIFPAAMGWIVFAIGYVFFTVLGKIFDWDEKTVVCLTLCVGLGNTSFVGLPMIETFFGQQYIGIGMLCDTGGSFLALAIPGIILAAKVSGAEVNGPMVAKKVLLFPPFLAVVLGIALQPVTYPDWVTGVLTRLGSTLSPLALLSVGMTLSVNSLRGHTRELLWGLGYKLVLAPLIILLLYMVVLGKTDVVTRVTVFEAAMGPMVTGGIIAMSHGVKSSLAVALVGVGTVVSFATLPAWYAVIQLF
ncbi:AEC family transporter [Pseudodesulfovibrio sp. JC047]|uniref:AEC family transporter n=1 Tax=Pseudodesulfovibrio sp. JC047 TaxID=2683199 RepID=UPI0013CFA68C|nr:AEC family transporter [Pseudodesulfovibrio sp. JC047]NDV19285.1 AEC family transporter [Pseudodesulfovibrio sp. JC047]